MLDLSHTTDLINSISENIGEDYASAHYQYELIMSEIKEFESLLDSEHEIALRLCNFGENITMMVTEIGYADPSLIFYYGYVNNKYSTLIQHVNQINFLLTSVDKPNTESSPRRVSRIGFVVSKAQVEQ